jgi:dihydrofolate reductase
VLAPFFSSFPPRSRFIFAPYAIRTDIAGRVQVVDWRSSFRICDQAGYRVAAANVINGGKGGGLMQRPYKIEGYAIVSTDGMLANAHGIMPDVLKIDADQQFFARGLDGADAVVHGRHSHENQPHSPGRRRLILTRRVPAVAPDSSNPKALFWNPAGCTWDEALRALGVERGVIGIIGGTDVFGLFLPIGYDAFHLSRAARVSLPGGRPVFPDVPARTPEDVLAGHGLTPGPVQVLDKAAGATLVTWRRQADF